VPSYYGPQNLPENSISVFKNIKNLTIANAVLREINFKEIKTLSNLNELNLIETEITEIPREVEELENLTTLNLELNHIENVPDFIGNLVNLKKLVLKNNELIKFPSTIQKLTNLELLDLSYNKIEDEIPSYLNSFENLKEVVFSHNTNITGITLSNDSLIECKYDLRNICYEKHVSCLDSSIEACNGSGNNVCQSESGECNNETIKDDCKEILNYIKDKYPERSCDCTNNSEGEVVELNIINHEFTDEDIKKILSYNTISKLIYTLVVLPDYELDDNT